MNDLHRELAPISSAAWAEVDTEATRTLSLYLAARKLVDFTGPVGLETAAINTGRLTKAKAPERGVEAHLREVQPLVQVRVPFELARAELEAVARGAADADLGPVTAAAQQAALLEDRAVFHGYADARITGICQANAKQKCALTTDYTKYPAVVVDALQKLRDAGVEGPYAIALGPRCYAGLTQTVTPGGYPIIRHVQQLLDGPVVWAPGVDGAAVVSLRGGDFALTVGQDFSVGYLDHTATVVRLYIQESFTFRVLSPEAGVPLVYGTSRKR